MSKLNPEQRLFIDGALVHAADGRTYNVVNPATEEVVGIVAAASQCPDLPPRAPTSQQ